MSHDRILIWHAVSIEMLVCMSFKCCCMLRHKTGSSAWVRHCANQIIHCNLLKCHSSDFHGCIKHNVCHRVMDEGKRKKIAHCVHERKRKDKIKIGIQKIGQLLPPSYRNEKEVSLYGQSEAEKKHKRLFFLVFHPQHVEVKKNLLSIIYSLWILSTFSIGVFVVFVPSNLSRWYCVKMCVGAGNVWLFESHTILSKPYKFYD